MHPRSWLAVAAAVPMLVTACGGDGGGTGPTPAPQQLAVTTGDAPPPRFIPATGKLAAGGTVTFTNGSPVDHNVISDAGAWPQTLITPGASFSVTLPTAGNYTYHCSIHAGMTGVVRVE